MSEWCLFFFQSKMDYDLASRLEGSEMCISYCVIFFAKRVASDDRRPCGVGCVVGSGDGGGGGGERCVE